MELSLTIQYVKDVLPIVKIVPTLMSAKPVNLIFSPYTKKDVLKDVLKNSTTTKNQ
jgi:hypothetical protein